MTDSSDYFEVIDSQYELIEQSIREEAKKGAPTKKVYGVKIKASKNQVDLNLLQNQFYEFEMYKFEQKMVSIQRRYSQFALIYEILSKKEPGYIFPAFPENGIFAFMKSKVTMIKDEAFVNTRIKVIERFFNKIFNESEFNPEFCKEIQEFTATGKQFEARKQIEKSGGGVLGISWNKLKNIKNYFTISKQNKYKEHEDKIIELKAQYEFLYVKCHELIQLLQEERAENTKIHELEDPSNHLVYYKQFIYSHDLSQQENIKELEALEFILFCENEDMLMAKKIIDRMNELKKDEDNYNELKQTEQKFGSKIDNFLSDKAKSKKLYLQHFQEIITNLKKVSRFEH